MKTEELKRPEAIKKSATAPTPLSELFELGSKIHEDWERFFTGLLDQAKTRLTATIEAIGLQALDEARRAGNFQREATALEAAIAASRARFATETAEAQATLERLRADCVVEEARLTTLRSELGQAVKAAL